MQHKTDLPETPKSTESRIIDTLQFIFPRGNLWVYWLYLPSLITIPMCMICVAGMFGQIDAGMTIQTDTFIAHMPYTSSGWATPSLTQFYNYLTQAWLWIYNIFVIHTTLSIIADFGYWVASLRPKRDTL